MAAGRSTMVFSKSAFSPLAAGAASPTNLSLYLPSSMTSLFCRKCFLIGLPLTTVPLVLPRSSRKESLRMVTITACSPLTARLSIWISLWGFRPRVVRSFVRGISLSTSPSILRISFAIAVSSHYETSRYEPPPRRRKGPGDGPQPPAQWPHSLLEPSCQLRHHAARRRKFALHADQDHAHV